MKECHVEGAGTVGRMAMVLPCKPGAPRDLHARDKTLVLSCVLRTKMEVKSPRSLERGTNLEL